MCFRRPALAQRLTLVTAIDCTADIFMDMNRPGKSKNQEANLKWIFVADKAMEISLEINGLYGCCRNQACGA